MIRVLLVDDHRLIRESLRRVVEAAADMEVVGDAASGEEAIHQVRELAPDVVLMDVNMPGVGGLEATRRLKAGSPGTRIVVLSAYAEPPYPLTLIQAGASGYLTKDCDHHELLEAIRRVAAGETCISVEVARQLANGVVSGVADGTPLERLSSRELQVLMMVVQGMATKGIAESLQLSPKTVATYRYRLYDKLKVRNDVELTKLAIRHGVEAGLQS